MKDTTWVMRAACSGHPNPDQWFEDHDTPDRRAAVDVCRGCRVRTECATHAMDAGEEFGVWGGMTPQQRSLLRRQRNMPPILPIPTITVEPLHQREPIRCDKCGTWHLPRKRGGTCLTCANRDKKLPIRCDKCGTWKNPHRPCKSCDRRIL